MSLGSSYRRRTILSTRSATESPSRSKGTRSVSAASDSWIWKVWRSRPKWRRRWKKPIIDGHTMVMVSVDGKLGGALELHAAVRPEVRQIVQGLRDRGIKHIAIISGDHEAPTRKLAESLGMDRYFAQVLPADKADHVIALQKEGRKVCFVGDGINDSIALKQANVSISLRGASTIATDTAHIVFLEEGLSKLCDLRDIARDLDRNVRRSWGLILAPNIACIAGVFTLGFGIMTSVITNNVAAMAALANGMLPLSEDRPDRSRKATQSGVEASLCAGKRSFMNGRSSARSTTQTRAAIHSEFRRRRRSDPVPAELSWHVAKPELTIRSQWISFVVNFSHDAWSSMPNCHSRPRCSPPTKTAATRFDSSKAWPITSTFDRHLVSRQVMSPGSTTMAHKKTQPTVTEPCLDLRFKPSHEPLDPNAKRFDVFLIDSGWNSAVGKFVRSHLPTMLNFEKEDAFLHSLSGTIG